MSRSESTADQRRIFLSALQHALDERGWIPADLARAAKISRQAISEYTTKGKEPLRSTVWRMEAALGLPPGDLSRHLGYVPTERLELEERRSLRAEQRASNIRQLQPRTAKPDRQAASTGKPKPGKNPSTQRRRPVSPADPDE